MSSKVVICLYYCITVCITWEWNTFPVYYGMFFIQKTNETDSQLKWFLLLFPAHNQLFVLYALPFKLSFSHLARNFGSAKSCGRPTAMTARWSASGLASRSGKVKISSRAFRTVWVKSEEVAAVGGALDQTSFRQWRLHRGSGSDTNTYLSMIWNCAVVFARVLAKRKCW